MIRAGIKSVLNVFALGVALPAIVWAISGLRLFGSEDHYSGAAYALALIPGKPGVFVRRAFYAVVLKECRWDCTIHFGSVITHPTARIGRNVWIGAYSLIGRCRIEDDVLIGSRVSVLSGRRPHRFDAVDRPIQSQSVEFQEIRLGADSWLGEGCIVMADLGRGSVVGAGAVVVKACEDFAILAGNPARPIGRRGQPEKTA